MEYLASRWGLADEVGALVHFAADGKPVRAVIS